MSDKDQNTCFTSPVGKENPVTKEWVEEIGRVSSTYLTDANGNFIKDPATGERYIVPVGYDPQDTIRRFSKNKIIGFNPTDPKDDSLLGYRTNGPLDLQRNFNGKSFGGFVPAYTPIASFDVGLAAAVAGMTLAQAEWGGGTVNLKNVADNLRHNQNVRDKAAKNKQPVNPLDYHVIPDSSGLYFNNKKNTQNIALGYSYYKPIRPDDSEYALFNDIIDTAQKAADKEKKDKEKEADTEKKANKKATSILPKQQLQKQSQEEDLNAKEINDILTMDPYAFALYKQQFSSSSPEIESLRSRLNSYTSKINDGIKVKRDAWKIQHVIPHTPSYTEKQKAEAAIKIMPLEQLSILGSKIQVDKAAKGTLDLARAMQGEFGNRIAGFTRFGGDPQNTGNKKQGQALQFDAILKDPEQSTIMKTDIQTLATWVGAPVKVTDHYSSKSDKKQGYLTVEFANKKNAAQFSKLLKKQQAVIPKGMTNGASNRFLSKVGITDSVTKEWKEVGRVNSTDLTDIFGNYVINPKTGQPYIVPVGYDPQDTINRFADFKNPLDAYNNLLEYHMGGKYDLQRNIKGESYGQDGASVKEYASSTAFDFGLAAAASRIPLRQAKKIWMAGKLKDPATTLRTTGTTGKLNSDDLANIKKGFSYLTTPNKAVDRLKNGLENEADPAPSYLDNQDLFNQQSNGLYFDDILKNLQQPVAQPKIPQKSTVSPTPSSKTQPTDRTLTIPEEPTPAASFTQDNQTASAPQSNGLNFAAILKNLQPSAKTRGNIQNVADFMGLPVNMADKTYCAANTPKPLPPPIVGDTKNRAQSPKPLKRPQPIAQPGMVAPTQSSVDPTAPSQTEDNQENPDKAIKSVISSQGETNVYELVDGSREIRIDGSRPWRTNNPGSLDFISEPIASKQKAKLLSRKQKKYQGLVGFDKGGFGVFATKAMGRKAQGLLLKEAHGDRTIEQMLPEYAKGATKKGLADYGALIHKIAEKRGLNLHGRKIASFNTAEFSTLQDAMIQKEGVDIGTTKYDPPYKKTAIPSKADTLEPTEPVAPVIAAPDEPPKAPYTAQPWQALPPNYRHKEEEEAFSGIADGASLAENGSYTDAEVANIRKLKSGNANTSTELKGGMPAAIRQKITDYASQYGLDPVMMQKIAALASGGNANAVSERGSIGIGRLTGKTASRLGVKNRFDVDQNIAGMTRLANESVGKLSANSLPATPENVYMMRQLGNDAALEVINAAKAKKPLSGLSSAARNEMAKYTLGANSRTAAEYVAAYAQALEDSYQKVVVNAAKKPNVQSPAAAPATAPEQAPPVQDNPTVTPTTTPEAIPVQKPEQSSDRLDESPDKGLGYISSQNEGDVGSVVKGSGRWSYGIYQFDSKSGIYHFLNSSPKYAAQLNQSGEIGSPGFNKKWEDIGNSDPIGFEAAQRAAGKKYFFDPVVAAGGKLGFDTSSRAVQEALYSGSIQHGHWIGEVLPDIAKHNKIKNLTVEQQIHALYEGRRHYADTLKKSTRDIVKKRTFKEEPEVMKLVQWELRHPKAVDKPPTSKNDIPPSTSAVGEPPTTAQKSPRVIKIVPLEKLRIKSAESTAGGEALEGTMDFARVVQGELGDEMIRFNGFNDEYHQKREPGSNHTQGLSFDIKIRNPKDSAKIQAKIKQLAAFFGLNIVVDDEYKKLSTNGNYPHIHVNFHNKQDAALFSKRFKQYQAETAKPISALTQPLADVDDTSFTGLPASPDSASASSAAAPSSAAVASGIAATVTQDALATYAAPTAPTVPFSPPLPPSAAPITVPPPSIAQAPDITMPLANNTPQKPSAPPPIITADAGQDVPDRQIAHIVNGGIGGLV